MSSQDKVVEDAKKTTISYALDWGKSPLPPMVLATMITALHARPFQPLPLTFAPVLLFSTYLNLSSYVVDSAGLTAAWSGLYLLLANRRKASGKNIAARFGNRFGARGIIRGTAMGVAGINLVGGGLTYAFGRRKDEDHSL
ncbi:Altered inheritance of mitochondria 19 protein [Rutstroemia sp. NJR-2017a BBW]|nr:Altered inheritance of mitochondria 19 protein [Rutstroemia sp. NJR-2017a BBW]